MLILPYYTNFSTPKASCPPPSYLKNYDSVWNTKYIVIHVHVAKKIYIYAYIGWCPYFVAHKLDISYGLASLVFCWIRLTLEINTLVYNMVHSLIATPFTLPQTFVHCMYMCTCVTGSRDKGSSQSGIVDWYLSVDPCTTGNRSKVNPALTTRHPPATHHLNVTAATIATQTNLMTCNVTKRKVERERATY